MTSADLLLPSRRGHPRWRTVILISVGVCILFSFRDLLVLLSDTWPHLYGVVGVSRIRWEEVVFYLPYATAFSWSNPLPLAPAVDTATAGLGYLPALSIFLLGLFHKVLAFSNLDLFLVLLHSLLPLANFWLAYLIYRPFIQKTWAIFLSFLGICYFSEFSSAGYVLGLLSGAGGAIELASLQPPEITRIPFPGLSLALFSSVFYLCIRERHLSTGRVGLLGFLWGLQAYVYPFNLLAGSLFFVLWLLYALYVTERGLSTAALARTAGAGIAGMGLALVPFALLVGGMDDTLGSQFAGRIAWAEGGSHLFVSEWGWFIAYLVPTLFVVATVFVFRGDFYELAYRFYPIFAVMVVDFVIGGLHLVTGRMFAPELYQHRISGILFRFFYFIPLIYFLQAPLKQSFRGRHGRYQEVVQRVHELLQAILIGKRYLFCGTVIALLAAIEVMGGLRQLRQHENHVAPAMRRIAQDLALVTQDAGPGVVVLDEPAANLLVPVVHGRPSLLASSYGNFVGEEEIRSRLILYAKLVGWDRERFLRFVTPGPQRREDLSVIGLQALDDCLGWWLLRHDRHIGYDELAAMTRSLGDEFDAFDVAAGIRRFRVATVLASVPIEADIVSQTRRVGNRYLTTFPKVKGV
jgi:hypothetical protein